MHIVEDHIEKANNVMCERFYTPPQSPFAHGYLIALPFCADVDAQVDAVVSFVARRTSVMLELHQKNVIDLLHPCCKPFTPTTSSLMQKLKAIKEPCFGNVLKSV